MSSGEGIEFHPESKWEEPYLRSHRMLTLYDLNRIPRPVKDPNLRLTIPLKALNAEFKCPICLGYIRRTSIVMECLHRFCDECIQKCLRFGKKECPSCRIHIPTRRSLRYDEDFDILLLNILGDVRVLEEHEESEAKIARSQNVNSSDTRKRGMLHQQEASQQTKTPSSPGKKSKTAEPDIVENTQEAIELEPENPLNLTPSALVEMLLLRYPGERQLDRLYKNCITISSQASVHVLKVFLSRKLPYPDKDDIVILAKYEDDWVAMEDSLLIGQVHSNFCKDKMLILCYRLRRQVDSCN